MTGFSEGRKAVLVTGGRGFLGAWLNQHLCAKGYLVCSFGSKDFDLCDYSQTHLMMDYFCSRFSRYPDYVIHAAASVGGIKYNRENHASILVDNVRMALNVLETCRLGEISKVALVGSVCAYPFDCVTPFAEDHLWDGYPDDSNAGYGISKRVQMEMGKFYHQQYGMNIVNVVPTNFYGPGDDFRSENSHVIPAMIRKFHRFIAYDEEVIFWGDGTPTRDFLYVDDVAQGIVTAMQVHNSPDPINLGSTKEVSMLDLAALIQEIMLGDRECSARWTGDKNLNGQQSRQVDISRAVKYLNWTPKYNLERGLRETIASIDFDCI